MSAAAHATAIEDDINQRIFLIKIILVGILKMIRVALFLALIFMVFLKMTYGEKAILT